MKVVGCKLKIEDAKVFPKYVQEQGKAINDLLKEFVLKCIKRE